MMTYQNRYTGVTVCTEFKEGHTFIGVALCGNLDRYNADLGVTIATNRCEIQPYAIIKGKLSPTRFDCVAHVINDHMHRSAQWEPKLPRFIKRSVAEEEGEYMEATLKEEQETEYSF